MSEMSSFYGGKQGVSIVIVKTFDGIDIPQVQGNYVYRRNAYAADTNNNIFITDLAHGGNIPIDIENDIYLIAETSENYMSYNWVIHNNDGSQIGETGYNFPYELAEGMVQFFARGFETTDKVKYSEYVIIDTIFGLKEFDNPDNGKVFRRGLDLSSPLAGAEYVGQIVGPKGDIPELDYVNYDVIQQIDPHIEVIASRADQDLVPGSFIDEHGERQFIDVIKYDYCYLRDPFGNIKKCFISMQTPTLVQDFEGTSMSPYDNRRTDPVTGEYYNYDLIYEDPDQYINNEWLHSFYQKWQIKVPHGYHGINVTDFEVVPTMTKPKNYHKNFAGTPIYLDKALTEPVLDENNDPIILEIPYTILRGNKYEDNVNWMAVDYDGQEVYASRSNGYKTVLRYKEINYDDNESGDITYYELDYFETGHRIVDNDGYTLPREDQLQFKFDGDPNHPLIIEDDSVNNKIIVNLPSDLQDFKNVSKYVRYNTDELTNYYKKTETYTQTEVDNKFAQLETNIDWKEAVATYADIATTYPNPEDGWTVNVKDTDYTYRYNGTEWVAISANAIPDATTSVKGLMTPAQVTKLESIETGAEVNVQSDWDQADNTKDDYIKNKITPITSAHIQSLFT